MGKTEPTVPCDTCRGTGMVAWQDSNGVGHTRPCADCGGSGRVKI